MIRRASKRISVLAMALTAGCGMSPGAAPSAPTAAIQASAQPAQVVAAPASATPVQAGPSASPLPQPTPFAQPIADQIIVKYKSADFLAIKAYRFPQAQVLDSYSANTSTQLHKIPTGTTQAQALVAYRQDPGVEYAEPNIRFRVSTAAATNDPMLDQQWALPRIHAQRGWDLAATAPPITVAVVDTGVDYNHPDLADHIIKGPNYVDNSMDPRDGYGHGTHVAGIIAALTNNGTGVAGVAPNARILAIRALDNNGYGDIFTVAKSVIYAAQHGAKIINISLGSPGSISLTMSFAGWYAASIKGCLLVAAAGNSGGPVELPARLSDYMAVGATDSSDKRASFSSHGAQLSVMAPGVKILSTLPTYPVTMTKEFNYPLNYGALDGTSMATPFVAAEAAIIWSRHPDWNYKQVRQAIERAAVQQGGATRNAEFGYGRIDLAGLN